MASQSGLSMLEPLATMRRNALERPSRPSLRLPADLFGETSSQGTLPVHQPSACTSSHSSKPPSPGASAHQGPACTSSHSSTPLSPGASGFTTRFGSGWMQPAASRSHHQSAVQQSSHNAPQSQSDTFIDMVRRSSSQQQRQSQSLRPLLHSRSPSSNGSDTSVAPKSPVRSSAASPSHLASPKSDTFTLTMGSPRHTSMSTSKSRRRSSLAPSESSITQNNAALSDMAYFSMPRGAESKGGKARSASSEPCAIADAAHTTGPLSPGPEVTLVPISEDGRCFRFVERAESPLQDVPSIAKRKGDKSHSRSASAATSIVGSRKAASVQSWLQQTTTAELARNDALKLDFGRGHRVSEEGERRRASEGSDSGAPTPQTNTSCSTSLADTSSADWMSTASASSASSLALAGRPGDIGPLLSPSGASSCSAGLTDAGEVSTSEELTECSSLPTPGCRDALELEKDPLPVIMQHLRLSDTASKTSGRVPRPIRPGHTLTVPS